MYIEKVYIIIFVVLLVVFINWISKKLYNPKYHIARLWLEINGLIKQIKEAEDKEFVYGLYRDEIQKKEILIRSIVRCYFNPEEDKEYIEANVPAKNSMELLKILIK